MRLLCKGFEHFSLPSLREAERTEISEMDFLGDAKHRQRPKIFGPNFPSCRKPNQSVLKFASKVVELLGIQNPRFRSVPLKILSFLCASMDEAVDREASEIDNLGETPEGTKVKKQATAKGKRDSAVQGISTYLSSNLCSGTNDSSIVSKRSVERTGYQVRSAEGQWLRYFVKKLVRRSPLINLGYFVRVKAVERVVDEVLASKCQC